MKHSAGMRERMPLRTSTHPRDRRHPLEPLVERLLDVHGELDVTLVACALAGATALSPAKGMRAYRLVAADVLGYMASAGRLTRHGRGSLRCPEAGGFWYTRAQRT